VRKGDDDSKSRADEGCEFVLRLREPSRGKCGALRLEGERLSPRERIELGRLLEGDSRELLLLPHTENLV